MTNSDWIAMGSVVFSCLALGVALYANRLQSRAARSDAEKELADQIDAIQVQMAQLSDGSQSAMSMQTFAKTSNVNAALQASLVRVAALIEHAGLHPNWYQNLVLAWASLELNDLTGAHGYVRDAHTLATSTSDGESPTTGASARILSLTLRASFCFQRGNDGDLDAAREDFEEARQIALDARSEQGRSATSARVVELYMRQVDLELRIGCKQDACDLMRRACDEWSRIDVPVVRQGVCDVLVSFARTQSWMAADELLPRDFVAPSHPFGAGSVVSSPLGDLSRLKAIKIPAAEGATTSDPGP